MSWPEAFFYSVVAVILAFTLFLSVGVIVTARGPK